MTVLYINKLRSGQDRTAEITGRGLVVRVQDIPAEKLEGFFEIAHGVV